MAGGGWRLALHVAGFVLAVLDVGIVLADVLRNRRARAYWRGQLRKWGRRGPYR
jgi:hypothetical protein